jgi:hypothetical protein
MKDDIMHETTIALSLPVDVATALWGRKRSETGRHERIKTLLAVGLFAEGAISLAKASALDGRESLRVCAVAETNGAAGLRPHRERIRGRR